MFAAIMLYLVVVIHSYRTLTYIVVSMLMLKVMGRTGTPMATRSSFKHVVTYVNAKSSHFMFGHVSAVVSGNAILSETDEGL